MSGGKSRSNPTREVDVNGLGMVAVTVLDPYVNDNDPRKTVHTENGREPERGSDCRAEGRAKVNGIPVRFSVELRESVKHYDKGRELETPVRYLWTGGYSTMTRQNDNGEDISYNSGVTDNMRRKILDALDAALLPFLDAHPELKHEARAVTLHNRVIRTDGEIREKCEEIKTLERRRASEVKQLAQHEDRAVKV